ncbi:MAG TPA: helix-turn-helix transcriptional regulator [Allosphingosinicella sp.]|uniref:helix-turn-helix domain-containing protein n=1 Tax=Allosphingosinicella sp. TaxID=2823234 RepID=UPI002ED91FE4
MPRLTEADHDRICAGEHPLLVIREDRGLTIEELAARTGFTSAWLSLVEQRKRHPTEEQRCAIAAALDCNQLDLERPSFGCSFDIAGLDEDEIIARGE